MRSPNALPAHQQEIRLVQIARVMLGFSKVAREYVEIANKLV
jgi:hypothetical protein